MFAKKIITTFLLFVLLYNTACQLIQNRDTFTDDAHQRAISEGTLLRIDPLQTGSARVNLAEVRYGNISQRFGASMSFDSSMIRDLFFEHGEVRLREKFVELGQFVSKGDVLAIADINTIEIDTEVEILERAITRLQQAFHRDRSQHLQNLDKMKHDRDLITRYLNRLRSEREFLLTELNSIGNEDQRKAKEREFTAVDRDLQVYELEEQTHDLRIQRQELIYNNFINQHNNRLAEYNERLDELYELLDGDKIIAPFDGVIIMERHIEVGKVMRHNELLYSMIDLSRLQFIIWGSIGQIRFGDVFSAALSGRDLRFDFQIVSDPIALNTRETSHNFIVQPVNISEFWKAVVDVDVEYSNFRHLRVDANVIRHEINNVLIIPRAAVDFLDDDAYVLLYEDGEIKSRLVHVGLSDNENIQIIAGLSEGQTIVR